MRYSAKGERDSATQGQIGKIIGMNDNLPSARTDRNSKGVILAVDDSLASLKLLVDTLTAEGYTALPADSGGLALAAVSTTLPEMILLDIRMAGMDGFEFIRQLKARDECRKIPVIFLSAADDVDLRVTGFKHGAVDFIGKPYQREELLARVASHLELSRLRESLERTNILQLSEANLRLEKLTREQSEKLRQLASDLTQAEQRERERIHELLHDEVQPLLVAARLSLSSLSARTAKEDLLRVTGETCNHISSVIQVARSLSVQLSPPQIRERGLIPALQSLVRWVADNHRLTVDLQVMTDAEPADVGVRRHCFNVIRELLMNVVKHAGVSKASVSLAQVDDATLRIIVADGGCGFDAGDVPAGTGLTATGRRLAMFGGQLDLNSSPGSGTTVTLRVPLESFGAAPPPTVQRE